MFFLFIRICIIEANRRLASIIAVNGSHVEHLYTVLEMTSWPPNLVYIKHVQ